MSNGLNYHFALSQRIYIDFGLTSGFKENLTIVLKKIPFS